MLAVVVCLGSANVALAAPKSVEYKGQTYYIVDGNDSAMNSGNKVCAAVGLKCAGYNADNHKVCSLAHPDAKTQSGVDGSKTPFYCNGAPQGGVCANEKNTCRICPTCNVGATCETQIGDLYAEMYVQCSPDGNVPAAIKGPNLGKSWQNVFNVPGRWWGGMRDTVARSFDRYREILGRLIQVTTTKHVVIQVQGPDGTVSADIPEDSLVCEFYQKNKKMVTCSALAAADQFCVTAFDSRFAKAQLCQDNGVIICSKPCTTKPQELKPQRCAFDADRPRGNQAAPLDFCTETKTIQVDTGKLGAKRAGEVCQHGGECATGICLGQPSDSGIKYFCSCSQTRHDTSCNK